MLTIKISWGLTMPTIDILYPKNLMPVINNRGSKDQRLVSVIRGGRAAGKTRALTMEVASRMLTIPGYRAVLARQFKTNVGESVKTELEDILRGWKVYDRFKVYLTIILGPNGSEARFPGVDFNPVNIKGYANADLIMVDEAENLSRLAIETILRTFRKKNAEIWFIFNPQRREDPIYSMFVDEETREYDDSLVLNVEHNYTDSIALPTASRQLIEQDKKYNQAKFMHEWMGGLAVDPAILVFQKKNAEGYGHWRIEQPADPIEIPEGTRPVFGLDIGHHHDPSVLIKAYPLDDVLYIAEEAWAKNLYLNDYQEFLARVSESKDYSIVSDSQFAQTLRGLRSFGYEIRHAIKGVGSVADGLTHLKSYDIVVSRDCEYMINSLLNYSYKVDRRTGVVTNDLEHDYSHPIDALRYALEEHMRKKTGKKTTKRVLRGQHANAA